MPVDWRSPTDFPDLPVYMQDWLLNTGSLTERLQALTSNFSVDLLGQEKMSIANDEATLLTDSKQQTWQVREVILQGSGAGATQQKNVVKTEHKNKSKDWVFARSVLPNELCNSAWSNLGNQPLGQRIFNDKSFVRSEFEIGQLRFHPLTHQPFVDGNEYWARRSKFKIDRFELIVAEAFLPDAPCYW